MAPLPFLDAAMTFAIYRASADLNDAMKPVLATMMARDLLDAGTDPYDFDAVVLELIARGHAARCIAACVDHALLLARGLHNAR